MPGKDTRAGSGLDGARQELAADLPGFLDSALKHYRSLAGASLPAEPKALSAHFSACRAALAHIEMLLKLAARIAADGEDEEDMADIIARAEASLRKADAEAER